MPNLLHTGYTVNLLPTTTPVQLDYGWQAGVLNTPLSIKQVNQLRKLAEDTSGRQYHFKPLSHIADMLLCFTKEETTMKRCAGQVGSTVVGACTSRASLLE